MRTLLPLPLRNRRTIFHLCIRGTHACARILTVVQNNGQELWYDGGAYTEARFIKGWSNLVGAFGSRANLFAIDLLNEPHGRATWARNNA
jgi:hypothetical protein